MVSGPHSIPSTAGAATREADERVLVFLVGEQRYALPVGQVGEIHQIVEFAPAPSPVRGALGVLDLRGTVIPALDARVLLDEMLTPLRIEMPMIVCSTTRGQAALVVDAVLEVAALSGDRVQDPPLLHAHAAQMIGVARLDDGPAYLIDAERLVGVPHE